MRRRFFVDRFENGRAILHGEAAHHLVRVLRAQSGQVYELSDGSEVWLGQIDKVGRDHLEFALDERVAAYQPTIDTTLLLAVVKFDSFEWAIEKATELGVSRIVPLGAARSEKGLLTAVAKRSERWRKILLEASQQSRRVRLPDLRELTKPGAAFAACTQPIRIMASERFEAASLKSVIQDARDTSAVLAIGPEGGWTEDEFQLAESAGFVQASLGGLILRTETAVVSALAALNYALAPAKTGQQP